LSRKKVEFLFSVIIGFFLIWAVWEARRWPASSKLFPWSLGFTVLALALIQIVVAGRAAVKDSTATAPGETALTDVNVSESAEVSSRISANSVVALETARLRVVTICVWIVGFYIGIWLLGFKIGSLCLTFLFLKFTANEGWMISTAIAAGTYLFFWLIFDIALGVPLGNGLIADYFLP
jgi:hypothetical protein